SKALRVLIIESTDADAEVLLEELRKGGYNPQFERVDTRTAMSRALTRQIWDVILSNHSLPRFNAMMALAVLKKVGQDIPFIVVSASPGEELAISSLKMGAHDYILKGNIARLVPAVERELQETEVRKERKRAELNVQHQASHDVL